MDIAHPICSTISSVSFSFLTADDVRRISVKQITNPVQFDSLNQPNIGGLYDPALGPTTHRDICATCRLGYVSCPGHFGHIELPVPVYHPLFLTTVYKLLRATCLFCHHFKVARIEVCKAAAKLKLLEYGLLSPANLLDDMSLGNQNIQHKEDGPKETVDDFEKRLDQYVRKYLSKSSSARRGDYKDGPVYQARKRVIDGFIKAAQNNSRRCSRPECGAIAYTFRKEGYTKFIEYDLGPKQKLQHAANGLRRPDILATDGAFSQPAMKEPRQTNATTTGSDDSEMEVDEVVYTDGEEEEEGGAGDDTASVAQGEQPIAAEPARAASGRVKRAGARNERLLAPEEVRAHLRRLFRNEATICSLIYARQGPYAGTSRDGLSAASADVFFIELMAVPPTRFRPPSKLGEQIFEHPQNELLNKIINTTYRVRDVNELLNNAKAKDAEDAEDAENLSTPADATELLGKLLELMITLQNDVNSFIDSSKSTTPVRQGKLPIPGVKQGLEKKQGLFRMHMMGKRVNYAARSVISPDVNIETNEIGVPPVFARKLTFAEPVTPHNVTEMRELVIRGPRQHPGASMVQFEDGSTQMLDKLSKEQRTAIANQLLAPRQGEKGPTLNGLRTKVPFAGKKVFRHLRDGDILLLNRQPTLHKPSMMAHKAKVLQGEQTIRMHYANCNSYNADFDGDEMNIHFPQSQVARSEAMFIANTDNQYLVPTSGKPLRGLIQDHVVAGLWMTNKATFFTREEYQQLIYGALRLEDDYSGCGRVLTVPPAIWKPHPLWTGKQIISTVLKNITQDNAAGLTLKSSSQIKNASWNRGSYPSKKATKQGSTNAKSEEQVRLAKGLSEEKVLFFAGDFVRGVLDKSQFGAASYGLVHAVYEIYGAETAGRLLGILSRLFTNYLQHRAFTCRMDDLALTPAGEKARKKVLQSGKSYGTQATESIFADFDPSSMSKTEREEELKKRLVKVYKDDKEMAGLDNAVKGKMKELFQDVVNVTLPKGLLRSFPDNHMQAMTSSGAKGSATNARQISVLLGQQELEGRRVPVMVSGKTLPSFKPYETSAIAGGYISSRFLTGLKPQEFYFHCMAGREGLIDTAVKTSRSGYLQRCLIKHLEGIRVHYDHTVRGADSSVYQFLYGEDGLDVTKQAHLDQFAFILKNHRSFVRKWGPKNISGRINEDDASDHMKATLKKKMKHPDRPLPPTTLELYSPVTHLGATSEKFAEKVEAYIKENKNHLLRVKGGTNMRDKVLPVMKDRLFRALMQVKYLRSLAEPGEAVGLLASQSVGEPSTQMTLNTFHFAGHGAANVTLGIPRLREIIMTASMKPKTPMMSLPIRKGTPAGDVKAFCQKTSRLKLSYLVDKITVVERIPEVAYVRYKVFSVTINFFPPEEYMEEHCLTTSQLLEALGSKFARALKRATESEFHKLDANMKVQLSTVGEGKAIRNRPGGQEGDDELEEGDRDGESEVGDGDADADMRKSKRKEQATYDDDDGDAEEVNSDAGADDDVIVDEAAPETRPVGPPSEADGDDAALERDEADDWKAVLQKTQDAFLAVLPLGTRSFSFDNTNGLKFDLEYAINTPKLLLITVLERVCRDTVVREVSGVSNCHFPREGTEAYQKVVENGIVVNDANIVVEGSNLRGMAHISESIVDTSRVKTNDIGAVLKTYGVEAARATILQEIGTVFAAYAINVNARHLMLIADYMTFDGGYKPFNRAGIATHSSPLLKASYETTAAFISDATLYGDFDNLTTPSGNIVLGRPSQSGTGIFDLVTQLPPST